MISQDLLLVKLLKLILFVIPEIELPTRVGAPYVYSPAVIACCFVIMVAKKLSVRGLYALLTSTDDYQAQAFRAVIPFPKDKIPDRRTFDRRLLNWQLSAQLYMLSATQLMIEKFKLGTARLAVDNRMFEAFGAIWHQKDIKAGFIPEKLRNVDTTAGWGVSAYRKWVFGHGLDVFVTVGKIIFPVLAIGRSLRLRGNTVIKQAAHLLPKVKKGIAAADSEYDDQNLAQVLKTTGRNLHAAQKKNPQATPGSKTYQRRKVTVEPFYERFLLAFHARGKLDRKGPQAWPYLVTCCFLYQLMVIYSLMQSKSDPAQITHLIRML